MIRKLKGRIILLFSTLSILVMLVVVAISFLLAKEWEETAQLKILTGHVDQVVKEISLSGKIDRAVLEELRDSGIYVYIEDNGSPLLSSGQFNQEIIDGVKRKALEQGQSLQNPWDSTSLSTSFLYSVNANADVRVFSRQLSLSLNQWITILAFQNRVLEKAAIHRLRILYGLLAVAAAGALVLISWFLAGIAVRPTKDSLRLQKEFLSAAGHEIRTPLAVIKSSLSAMSLRPEERGQFSAVIHSEVDHLARLTDDLTLLGDTGIATWGIKKEAVNVDTLLMRLYESYQPLAAQQGHKLTLELAEEPFPIMQTDEKRVVQLLGILLNNGLSHTPTGTEIWLGGRLEGKRLCLFVRDNGPGIPREHEKRIFQRFYRINQSHTEKKHMGLGLAIAKEIAELHGGKLAYQPTQGGGATFEVILPLK